MYTGPDYTVCPVDHSSIFRFLSVPLQITYTVHYCHCSKDIVVWYSNLSVYFSSFHTATGFYHVKIRSRLTHERGPVANKLLAPFGLSTPSSCSLSIVYIPVGYRCCIALNISWWFLPMIKTVILWYDPVFQSIWYEFRPREISSVSAQNRCTVWLPPSSELQVTFLDAAVDCVKCFQSAPKHMWLCSSR